MHAAGAAAVLDGRPPVAAARENGFSFVAMGCMPYGEGSLERFERLIREAARDRPAFALHVGDIKSSMAACDDHVYLAMRQRFQAAPFPLIYTPGDNEWTDCSRVGRDPIERLEFLRRTFFSQPQRSLGRRPLALVSQAQSGGEFPENARFVYAGVVFATVHVVGSNNNLLPEEPRRIEHERRVASGRLWLDQAFEAARHSDAPALVLAWHADPFVPPPEGQRSGFASLLEHLRRRAGEWRKPVLVVHADTHSLAIYRWREGEGGEARDIPSLTFLRVMGAADIHAVEVEVRPADPAVFGFRPIIVPENGLY